MPGMHRVKRPAEQTGFHLQTGGVFVGQEPADGHFHELALYGKTAVMLDKFAQVAVVNGIFGHALVAAVHINIEV